MPLPDRDLRRRIVALAAMSEEDRSAIIEMLSPVQRTRISALLLEYAGLASARPHTRQAFEERSLAPWLVAQLRTQGGMTISAYAALQDCLTDIMPDEEAGEGEAERGQPSLLARIPAIFRSGSKPA